MDQISLASNREQSTKTPRVGAFLGEVKQEFKKIAWTTRSELISYTKVVFTAIFVGGFVLYIMDLLVHGALGLVAAIIRGIGG